MREIPMSQEHVLFRIGLDVNLHHAPGFAQEILNALSAMEGRIMGKIEDLQAKADTLSAQVKELKAQVGEGNDKTDALILVATATKDALVAAREEIARLQAGGAATPEQLDALGVTMDAAIADANAGIAEANAQDAETDAAAGTVAP